MHKHSLLWAFTWLPASRQRALRRNLFFIGATLAVGLLSKAFAAGGTYVVDDGAINAPGECNVDAGYTRSIQRTTLSAACTSGALPNLQWGAAIEDEPGLSHLSPQLKGSLWAWQDAGVEIAWAAAAHIAVDRRHPFDGADLGVPLTWQAFETLRLNLNAGWSHAYDDGEQNQRLTWGTGLEYRVADSLTLLAERYGQQHGDQAWQAGPRVHLGKQVDVDLVVGRNLTGDHDRWLTTGATLRF